MSLLHVLGFGGQSKTFTSSSGLVYEYVYVEKEGDLNSNHINASHRILSRTISSMLVYTDIVEPSLIGDSQANYLGFLPIQTIYGQQGYWNFQPPYYVPVKTKQISNITIKLCQDTGDLMPIEDGKVICRLHFRRVSPFR